VIVLALLAAGKAPPLVAQDSVCTGVAAGSSNSAAGAAVAVLPAIKPAPVMTFPIGERLTFSAKYGVFSVGGATMEVMGIDTIQRTEAVHIRFRLKGGALWYSLDQTIESWVGLYDFRSRRFTSIQDERGKHRERRYDIYPDSGFYREQGRDTTFATVLDPLDDASFLYWIRTVPLEVGKKYEYARFRPDRNPVIIEVLGYDHVSVAAKWRARRRARIPQGRGFARSQDASGCRPNAPGARDSVEPLVRSGDAQARTTSSPGETSRDRLPRSRFLPPQDRSDCQTPQQS
jgi:hypothetical protein